MLHLFSQETDLLMKVIMKCVNIKLWDILGCFHYILNVPRICRFLTTRYSEHYRQIKKYRKIDNFLNLFVVLFLTITNK